MNKQEVKFNNLELRKDIKAIVPNIDDLQLSLIEISVAHLVDVYVKAKLEQQQQEIERLKVERQMFLDNSIEYQKQLQQVQNTIKETLELLKRGGPGTRSQVQTLLEKALEGESS
jgi:DNA topoisomerase IA